MYICASVYITHVCYIWCTYEYMHVHIYVGIHRHVHTVIKCTCHVVVGRLQSLLSRAKTTADHSLECWVSICSFKLISIDNLLGEGMGSQEK